MTTTSGVRDPDFTLKNSRLVFIKLIHYTHWAVILFVVLGWLIPVKNVLLMHLGLVPLLVIHWQTNHGRCVLTELEAKFKDPNSITAAQEEESFIRKAFRNLLGIQLTDRVLKSLIYSVMAVVWVLSVLHYTNLSIEQIADSIRN